jgi:hypothetical protein
MGIENFQFQVLCIKKSVISFSFKPEVPGKEFMFKLGSGLCVK